MLWLASLLGAMAVGAVSFFDFSTGDEEPDGDDLPQDALATDTTLDLMDSPVGQINVEVGGASNDMLEGSDDEDRLGGYDSDDTIMPGAGDDEALGMDGDDLIDGGGGDDLLRGGDGDDALEGGTGADTLFGYGDTDTLGGGAGDDSLHGGEGEDVLDGGTGDDVAHGGLGSDLLRGGAGQDTLFGGWGDDLIDGRDADTGEGDFLNGGGGDDVIFAGGVDVVTSGAGADIILADDDGGKAIQITDFDSEEDSIVLLWEDSEGAEAPHIEVEPSGDSSGAMHVVMNGVVVAQVSGSSTFTLGDVTLISRSAALSTGLLATLEA